MALTPVDEIHALQIQAGIIGRKAGHAFEDDITLNINSLTYPYVPSVSKETHVFRGNPEITILDYICHYQGFGRLTSAVAISTGALATSENGRKWLQINGADVRKCKSDIVLTLHPEGYAPYTVGISTKQCNNKTPTNAQLYFTTARGFANLLRKNGIDLSDEAVSGLRQFCGDVGFRPLDIAQDLRSRLVDPRGEPHWVCRRAQLLRRMEPS